MKSKLLEQAGNWTPSFDFVSRKFSKYKSVGVVLGKMWRYSQMTDGVCRASIDRMAGELGISRNTFQDAVKLLESTGYLVDLTPTVVNHPHSYTIVEDKIISDSLVVSQCSPTEQPVTGGSQPVIHGVSASAQEDNSIKTVYKDSINKEEIQEPATSTSKEVPVSIIDLESSLRKSGMRLPSPEEIELSIKSILKDNPKYSKDFALQIASTPIFI